MGIKKIEFYKIINKWNEYELEVKFFNYIS